MIAAINENKIFMDDFEQGMCRCGFLKRASLQTSPQRKKGYGGATCPVCGGDNTVKVTHYHSHLKDTFFNNFMGYRPTPTERIFWRCKVCKVTFELK